MIGRIRSRLLLRALIIPAFCLVAVWESEGADPVVEIALNRGELIFTWPVTAERYFLESSELLSDGWTFRQEAAEESNGVMQVRIAPESDAGFFRLHAPLSFSDTAEGGALYDNWWNVTGEAPPKVDHSLWEFRPDKTANTRTGSATWRCKECHGWDYKGVDGAYAEGSHRTGFAGIFDTSKTAPEIFDVVKNNHGYGEAGLTDPELWSLVKFVLDGQIDTSQIIDESGKFVGDRSRGKVLYEHGIGTNDSCATCHGPDGLATPPGSPEFDDYPGLISNENPWEFQHKVRFGQPGTRMLGSEAGGGTIRDVADLAAYVQTLPREAPGADVTLGGLLYDKWWVVTGAAAPESDHPLWKSRPDPSSNTRTGSATWRCKECHGWDYKGVDGAYGDGSHRTGFGGIWNTRLSAESLFALLKEDHGYGAAGLSDRHLDDLVKFVREGLIDTAEIIDEEGRFRGDMTNGRALYLNGVGSNRSCAECHGDEGLETPPGVPKFEDYPGLIANENPWEFQHKVRFGQPGTDMPGTTAAGGTLQEVADLAAYSQTLPAEP